MTFKSTYINLLKHLLLLLFVLCCSFTAGFGQVKFSTSVNRQDVTQNDYLQVEYTIENAKSIAEFTFPVFKQFRIVQGPVQSSGMSVTNGVMSQYKGMTFVLQPVSKGKLVVPGARALVDGKPMRSNAVVVEVAKGSSTTVNPVIPDAVLPRPVPEVKEEFSLAADETLAEKIKSNLLVVAQVNKTTCYEGEPIVATYKLYSRLRSESRVTKRPSLNGFSVFDMVDQENNSPSVETLNGKSYNVHLIRKTQLFPLQPGTFTLDPVELENKVRFIKTNRKKNAKRSLQSFFDEFLNEDDTEEIQEHNFQVGSKPLTVIVKPLPVTNKPANFNGAVGQFKIGRQVKNTEVPAGDAIELKINIKGAGNFTMINAPVLSLPTGMQAYEPSIREEVDKKIYPLKGVKTFDYILTAKDTGYFDIPPVIFSYFDPASASYKTDSADGFQVHILPALHGASKKQRNHTLPVFADGRIDGIPVKGLLLIAAVLVVAGLGIYQWRIHKKTVNPVPKEKVVKIKTPSEIQPAVMKDLLEEARWALQSGESQKFYKEVNKAAWKVVTDKVQLPAAGLNKPNTIRQLQYKGVHAEVIQKFESVLNECEMALYTPVHNISDMHQTLNKAEDVIKTLKVSLS